MFHYKSDKWINHHSYTLYSMHVQLVSSLKLLRYVVIINLEFKIKLQITHITHIVMLIQ